MLQNGFVVVVGRMVIRAVRRTPAGVVQACKSDADSYEIYQRNAGRDSDLRRTEANFDSAFAYAVRRAIMH
jgi:hypothetical protein